MIIRDYPNRLDAKSWSVWGSIVVAALLVAACAPRDAYYQGGTPPGYPAIDIASIPDAVPHSEPLSETGNSPYVVLGQRYVPMASAVGYRKRGIASWYGKKFHGGRTSSGEPYDMFKMTAAHRTLPLPSYVRVTDLDTGDSVVVRVNDRGPFVDNRFIDLSYAAAYKLGIVDTGTAYVQVQALSTEDSSEVAAVDPYSADSDSVAGTSGNGHGYYLQYGAFAHSSNAQSLIRKLHEIGIEFAHIRQGDDGYYRVRSGPFSSSAAVERLRLRVTGLGLHTMVVTEL